MTTSGQDLTFYQDEPLFECNCVTYAVDIIFQVPLSGNYALTYCAPPACMTRRQTVASHWVGPASAPA